VMILNGLSGLPNLPIKVLSWHWVKNNQNFSQRRFRPKTMGQLQAIILLNLKNSNRDKQDSMMLT
jgi:hypothetical protein